METLQMKVSLFMKKKKKQFCPSLFSQSFRDAEKHFFFVLFCFAFSHFTILCWVNEQKQQLIPRYK